MVTRIIGAIGISVFLAFAAEGAAPQARERGMILREEVCRRPGFIVATGSIVRTSDGSDVFYLGGLTLMAPPNSGALTQIASLERSGRAYQLIAVPLEGGK